MSKNDPNSKVKVLIVDDSAFMRTALSRMVGSDSELLVVGTAGSGTEALQKLGTLDPDVITLDVQMPGLDGLETLRRIMAQAPRPVIMVSSVTVKDAETTFAALEAGAFDYVPKQLSSASLNIVHIREDLIAKIKAASGTKCVKEAVLLPRKRPKPAELAPRAEVPVVPAIVAIGVSTGGPKALQEILPTLPADLPVPILIVQHMPPGFTAAFAHRLDHLCAAAICEAINAQELFPGTIYIAPGGWQMTVERGKDSRTIIHLSDQPENQLHIPSVNIMMESVAANFGAQAMGVIMTGMGSDGSQGMEAIHRAGGITIGQDQATSAVYGMPRVCAEMGVLDRVVPLSRIAHEILQATRYRRTNVG